MNYEPAYSDFYRSILNDHLKKGIASQDMRTLVVCGGDTDRDILLESGFVNVTISNVDKDYTDDDMKPYSWNFQDAESLSYADNSFDLVIVCAGLHHCHSPHRALLEMYRVARRCVLVLEARDSILMRIAVRLGIVDKYELIGVVQEGYESGGVKNTSVPNYIYRWTEREVFKTIASYAPHVSPRINWYYGFAPPFSVLKGRKDPKGLLILYTVFPALWLITKIFKKQGNNIAFSILKPVLPDDLYPWLKLQGNEVTVNRQWLESNF